MNEATLYIAAPAGFVLFAIALSRAVERVIMGPERITIAGDSLITEAREVCDACPHSYQRSQLHGVVDGFVQRISEANLHGQYVAERVERQRLAAWVRTRKMG